MPDITISDDNWNRLKAWGNPMSDSPNMLLGKVLDLADSLKTGNTQKNVGRANEVENREDDSIDSSNIERQTKNINGLLEELDEWLASHSDVRFLHAKKTMSTYVLGKTNSRNKVFVPRNGNTRLYLPRIDYGPVDELGQVEYRDEISRGGRLVGWNIYAQFVVRDRNDLEFAKKLIIFALRNNG